MVPSWPVNDTIVTVIVVVLFLLLAFVAAGKLYIEA